MKDMHEVKIAELSKAAGGKLRSGKHPCQCRLAGKGMKGKSALMKEGNLKKLVSADKKGSSARIKLDEEELLANKMAGTGMMEGGRLKHPFKKLSKHDKDLIAKSVGAVVGTAAGAAAAETGPAAPFIGAAAGVGAEEGTSQLLGGAVKIGKSRFGKPSLDRAKHNIKGGRASVARTPLCKKAGEDLAECQGRVRNFKAKNPKSSVASRRAKAAEKRKKKPSMFGPVAQGEKDKEDERLGEEVGQLRRSSRLAKKSGNGLRGGAGGHGLRGGAGGTGIMAGGAIKGHDNHARIEIPSGVRNARNVRGGAIGPYSSVTNVGSGGNLIAGTRMGHPAMMSQASSANPFFATQFPPGLSQGFGLY